MLPFYTDLLGRFHDLHAQIEKMIDVLPPEALDWVPGSDMNSISVIITHLTGAERFLIGDVVMGQPSNRDRDAEFRVSGLTKDDLIHRLHEAEAYIQSAFETLTLSDLETTRLHPHHGNQVNVAWVLLHALDHVATHLGQLQITVQLWQQK